MTATPIQNSLDDIYSAFAFLKYEPFSLYTKWKRSIAEHRLGMTRLQVNPLFFSNLRIKKVGILGIKAVKKS